MIKAMGIGNLGKDPEIRNTTGGTTVANISIGCQRYVNKQKLTEWVRLVVFGRNAENAGKYLAKGSKIYFEGELQTRSWNDKNGNKRYTTEVVVSNIEYLSHSNGGGGGNNNSGYDSDQTYNW